MTRIKHPIIEHKIDKQSLDYDQLMKRLRHKLKQQNQHNNTSIFSLQRVIGYMERTRVMLAIEVDNISSMP